MLRDSLPSANATADIEALESRTMMSVVYVSPVSGDAANAINAAIASSHPGDTISFKAGTYSLSNRLSLPGNRIYQGNGVATINGPSASTSTFLLDGVTGATVTGFTFTGSDIQLNNCAVNIENNKFNNIGGDGLYATGVYSSHINNNSFSNVSSTGMMLYPGNNNTFDGNVFSNVFEPIHAMSGSYNDYSGNTITGASRNGIELQGSETNLTIDYNYIGQWNPSGNMQSDGNCAHMAISCATGGSGPSNSNKGENITIAHNTLLLNGRNGQTEATSSWALTAIEIMGDKNILITDNYANCGLFIMNGTSNNSLTSSGNTILCVQRWGYDATPWSDTPVSGTDNVYAWNASKPAVPSASATVSGAHYSS